MLVLEYCISDFSLDPNPSVEFGSDKEIFTFGNWNGLLLDLILVQLCKLKIEITIVLRSREESPETKRQNFISQKHRHANNWEMQR